MFLEIKNQHMNRKLRYIIKYLQYCFAGESGTVTDKEKGQINLLYGSASFLKLFYK
jgi:hypothetical protein